MRPRRVPPWLLLFGAVASCAPLAAQESCPAGRTALVLAGGGAKGLAHVGVIRVLDSLGIRPDLVVGTSMGSAIGALYASGMSPDRIDSLARVTPFAELVRPRASGVPPYLRHLRPLVSWHLGDRGFRLAQAAVPDDGIDALLTQSLLDGDLQARGDFGRLPIPFYSVATDLATRRPVVLHEGDLALAVRASMAIPLVFAPVRVGDRVLIDGGLAANVPVRIARQLGATRLIISDLVQRQADTADFGSPLTIGTYLVDYLFDQPGDTAYPGDIYIATDVTGARSLDFRPASVDSVIARGARAARGALAGTECLPRGTLLPAPSLPVPTRVTRVSAPGLSQAELTEILGTLGLAQGMVLDSAAMRRGLGRMQRSDRFRTVWLSPDTAEGGIAFSLRPERRPRGFAGLGLAYQNELGARLWAGATAQILPARALELSLVGTLGGLRDALEGAARWRVNGGRFYAVVALDGGHETLLRFSPEGEEVGRPDLLHGRAFAGFEWYLGQGWIVRTGGELSSMEQVDGSGRSALGPALHLLSTDDDGQVVVRLDAETNDRWHRVALAVTPRGAVTILPAARVTWARDVPDLLTTPLGGFEGFPGLHLTERRAAREAWGSATMLVPLFGALSARLQLASGRGWDPLAADAPPLAGDHWLLGGRAGLGVATPLGPVRLDYGVAFVQGRYRDQVFLGVGRWF